MEPAIRCTVNIQDQYRNTLYTENFSNPDELNTFLNTYSASVIPAGFIQSSFIPTRTDNWRDFAIDLFCPSFVNFALTINRIALRLFVSMIAIAWDAITFLPRLATTLVRCDYNRLVPKPHPLLTLIPDNLAAKKARRDGIFIMDATTQRLNKDTGLKEIDKKIQLIATKTLPKLPSYSTVIQLSLPIDEVTLINEINDYKIKV